MCVCEEVVLHVLGNNFVHICEPVQCEDKLKWMLNCHEIQIV